MTARLGILSDRIARWPVIVAVYVGVKYFRGMDSLVRVHDHLDHIQAVYSRMSLADLFARPGSTLDFTLGGLPRDFVGSEFGVGTIIAVAFPLVPGLVVAELLYRSIAYYGMRRLLRTTGLASEPLVYLGVPVLFAILPFYHPAFASLAGIPLLLSALIRIHRKPEHIDWLIIVAFPILGMAQATVPYAVLIIGYALVAVGSRLAPRRVLGAASAYVVALLLVEWRLPLSVFTAPESNRLDFGTESDAPLSGVVFSLGRVILENLEKHEFHAWSYLLPLTFVVMGGGLLVTALRRGRAGGSGAVLVATGAGIALVGSIGAIWPMIDSRVIRVLIGDYPLVQFDRVVWVIPGLAFLGLAASAVVLLVRFRGVVAQSLLAAVLVVQGVGLWQAADFSNPPLARFTLNEFFAPGLFQEIQEELGGDGDGRVVSVGLDPAVALYNGFDTADGAWSSYPLTYKREWELLIAPALAADSAIADYFTGYGNRVYVFQPSFGTAFSREIEPVDDYVLHLDPDYFAPLGVELVLSNGIVGNPEPLGLDLVGTFVDPEVPHYRISVYRVR